ncbi:DMT family transporter [Roseibium sp. MMSF_3412]|uniref:DMT family transporter n=1 Tax=Roseibium sp. MMSF_3412 TaxID=3046712 RepID=UPI00273DC2DF|nr:DMT family transporter [Roseibium sp. MMSF_3412]
MPPNSEYLRRENVALAYALALAGMAAFTPVFAAGKIADGLLPVIVLVWLRFLGGALTIVCFGTIRRVPIFSQVSPLWKLHLMRAFCGIGGLACTIYAASILPLADATAIGLTKGIIAIALAGLILKELITGRHWLSGGLCAIGAYLVVRSVGSSDGLSTFALDGVVAALMAAVFMACEALIMRYIAQRENTVTILAYVNVFASVLLTVPVIWIIREQQIPLSSLWAFAWLGPVAIIGQSLNISAYRRAGAATLAPIYYSSVVLAAAFAYLVWGEVPSPVAAVGAGLIVLGGLVLSCPLPVRKMQRSNGG